MKEAVAPTLELDREIPGLPPVPGDHQCVHKREEKGGPWEQDF